MITPAQMDDVFGALSSADEDGDAQTLARICGQLYGELGEAQARAATLHARLADVAARAARAAGVAHGGTPPAANRPGQWHCASCRAIAAEEPRVAPVAS